MRSTLRRVGLVLATTCLVASTVAFTAPATDMVAAEHTAEDVEITSNAEDGVTITATLFRPDGASEEQPVPLVLHSHGWAGSRTTSTDAFEAYLDAGFGVLSFDQRGFGESGGQANVQDPELEGKDVEAIIDYVAALDWVRHDRDAAGQPIADDPVLGAIGGSYGGGFQLIGALTELRDTGRTRFNALAPQITWFDLPESLAPQKVARSVWNAALYAVGATAIVDYVHPAFVWGSTTGQWPDGTNPAIHDLDSEFHEHSPVGFVDDGIRLDLPVLLGQGITDSLFPLNEAYHNFTDTLTPDAQEQSILVGYNGGHVLPTAFPLSSGIDADACSGDGGFEQLTIDFFTAAFAGDNPRSALDVDKPFLLTSDDGSTCIEVDSLDTYVNAPAGEEAVIANDAWMTTTGVGAPIQLEIAEGPMTLAGVPRLAAAVTTAGVDQRVFFAISVGTSEADAEIVQGNMLPLRKLEPVLQEHTVIELPGIAVNVEEGEKVYLTLSPTWDLSAGHSSIRTPGWVGFNDLTVQLPVVQ